MTTRHAALAVLVILLWGLNFIAAKLAVQAIPPIFVLFLRFCLVSALLLPFIAVPRGRFREIGLLSIVLGSIHFPLIFAGIRGVDSSAASIIVQLQVPFSSILAAVFFGDRLGWRRLCGMAVAFAGVIVIVGRPRFDGSGEAYLLLLCASVAFAFANIQIKRIGPIDGFQLNGWLAVMSLPVLLAESLVLESGQINAILTAPPEAWGGIVYSAIAATIVAYGVWYYLIARLDVSQVVPFLLLGPIVSVAGGVLMLGEPLTWRLVIGGIMTIVGIGVIILRRPGTVNERVSNPT